MSPSFRKAHEKTRNIWYTAQTENWCILAILDMISFETAQDSAYIQTKTTTTLSGEKIILSGTGQAMTKRAQNTTHPFICGAGKRESGAE